MVLLEEIILSDTTLLTKKLIKKAIQKDKSDLMNITKNNDRYIPL